MRGLSLALVAATLASCSTAPPPPNPRAEVRLRQQLAGRVAGKSVSCLPSRRADNMVIIDDNRILFRDGSTVYLSRLQGGCSHLGWGSYALVTRTPTTSLCRGDIAHVADLSTGHTVGSCVIGDFVPYTRP